MHFYQIIAVRLQNYWPMSWSVDTITDNLEYNAVKSQVRLFADDCLLYRVIRTQRDHVSLQQDLTNLEVWGKLWGIIFNAKKCYISWSSNAQRSSFSSTNSKIPSCRAYTQQSYLGITISSDLKWGTHIDKISKKAMHITELIPPY